MTALYLRFELLLSCLHPGGVVSDVDALQQKGHRERVPEATRMAPNTRGAQGPSR